MYTRLFNINLDCTGVTGVWSECTSA